MGQTASGRMLAPRAGGVPLACALVLGGAASLLIGCGENTPHPELANADPERGRAAIVRYGCVACHHIPGISAGWTHHVGPPLSGFAKQAYVAGVLPNTPENLVRWLQHPPEVDPRTAMPSLGLSAADAADVAAFLYSRR